MICAPSTYAEFLPASWIIHREKRRRCTGGLRVAQHLEEESIVLLKNEKAILPLNAAKIRSIAIIGGMLTWA